MFALRHAASPLPCQQPGLLNSVSMSAAEHSQGTNSNLRPILSYQQPSVSARSVCLQQVISVGL